MNPQPASPTTPGTWRQQSLGLLLGVGLLGLMLRFIDDFPEALQKPIFFLALLLANGLIYLLVTRRRHAMPGTGPVAERRLAAVGLLLHVLSAAVVVLVSVFIWLGINPH